ncbi:MAG TPA: DoxX family protein [Opitutaceae bacterium]|nr:DoxX family protein [Opitutaceae bacterium]
MNALTDRFPFYGVVTLRLALGLVMLAHAAAKYFIFTLPGTAAFFAAHGFPGWTAYPVFLMEAVGSVLLLVGWRPRWVAAALLPVMLGACFAHAPNGWMFTAPNGGWEYPAFLVLALGAQFLIGDAAQIARIANRRTGQKQLL